jgi:uncharacterized membrane protein
MERIDIFGSNVRFLLGAGVLLGGGLTLKVLDRHGWGPDGDKRLTGLNRFVPGILTVIAGAVLIAGEMLGSYYGHGTSLNTVYTLVVVVLVVYFAVAIVAVITLPIIAAKIRHANTERVVAGEGISATTANVDGRSLLSVLEGLQRSMFTGAVYVMAASGHRQLFLQNGQLVRAIGPDGDDEAVVVGAFREARLGSQVSIVQRSSVPQGGAFFSGLPALEARSH